MKHTILLDRCLVTKYWPSTWRYTHSLTLFIKLNDATGSCFTLTVTCHNTHGCSMLLNATNISVLTGLLSSSDLYTQWTLHIWGSPTLFDCGLLSRNDEIDTLHTIRYLEYFIFTNGTRLLYTGRVRMISLLLLTKPATGCSSDHSTVLIDDVPAQCIESLILYTPFFTADNTTCYTSIPS